MWHSNTWTGIIQDNHPLFILVWAGSILSVIITLIMGIMDLSGTEIYLLGLASACDDFLNLEFNYQQPI